VLGDPCGEPCGGLLSCLVAVERDHRRSRVDREDLLDLTIAEAQARRADRLEPIGEAGRACGGGDRQRVERSFHDHHLPVLGEVHASGRVERGALVVDGGPGWVQVLRGGSPVVPDG
jgi:hypothetical protein